MKFRMFVTKIDTEISIITLGSVCLLIAEFVKANSSISEVSLFTLSGFCLILSGVVLIYRETVVKGDILPTIEKKERGEELIHTDYFNIGQLGITNIFANTLFDIGIFFLIIGTISLLLSEFISSPLIKENFPYLIALIIIFFISNFFTRRFFAK
jgi:hypothetical protein